jgi:site-specific recombinase XerD
MLDLAITKEMSVKELADAVINHITELGYRHKTIAIHSTTLSRLVSYCEAQGAEQFTMEIGNKFVWDCYGMVFGDKDASRKVNRAIRMMADFQRYGSVSRRPSVARPSVATPKVFSEENKALFEGVLADYRKVAVENSVAKYYGFLLRFEKFMKERGVIHFNQLELQHVNVYVESFADAERNTVRSRVGNLKRLFTYAYENGYHHTNHSNVLPTATYRMYRRLPETFTPEEVERILGSINRQSPIGKRNYAIMLLIARLGLRISDVFGLKFGSIDWQSKTISITQQKTGNPLCLPLTEDTGWAVIEYLKNGRPETSSDYIFIRHNAPYDGMRGDFTKIISDAILKAGIKPTAGRTKGTHTLRHSIATSMLNNGTTVPEIAQILGHARQESSERYISVSIELLKQCALEVTV